MRKNILLSLLIISSVFIFSCKNENTLKLNIEIPENLISEDSLINILVDIHMTDAIVSQSKYINNEKRKLSYSAYAFVFEKYNINKDIFESSLKYYSRTPDIIKVIYDKVLIRMSKLEDELIAKDKMQNEEE